MAVGLLELRHWEHVRAVGLPGTTPAQCGFASAGGPVSASCVSGRGSYC